MCEGGIYDQLGGGFCRYSVDAHWTIPHFEKMLYDNGPLLALLADAWLVDRRRALRALRGRDRRLDDARDAVARGRLLLLARCRLASTRKASSTSGRARKSKRSSTQTSTRIAAPYFGLDRAANFEDQHWHLHVTRTLEGAASAAGIEASEARALLASARAKLFAARERRVRPGRDEKVLVSWNALVIRGMARAGRVFDRPDWIASARRALEFIVRTRCGATAGCSRPTRTAGRT